MTLDLSKPPFMMRDGVPMHFVGHDLLGKTVWQYPDGEIRTRCADGRMFSDTESSYDVINAPPPKIKEVLWANIYSPNDVAPRGFLYSTPELAKANVGGGVLETVPVEVEYTPSISGGYSNHPLETSTPNRHKPEPT